jgi:hypothetical protein
MTTCARCGAHIVWVTTAKNDRPMPLDAEPTPAGNVVLTVPDRLAVVLSDADRDRAIAAGQTVWRPHFASCPNYERGRR